MKPNTAWTFADAYEWATDHNLPIRWPWRWTWLGVDRTFLMNHATSEIDPMDYPGLEEGLEEITRRNNEYWESVT